MIGLSKSSVKELPPLKKAPGSRRNFSRGLPVPDISKVGDIDSVSRADVNVSRAGSYNTDKMAKNPNHDRVLFPTHVKESFLQRNKHMANAKMEQMASDFAKRAIESLK